MPRTHLLWYGPQIDDVLDVLAVLLRLMEGFVLVGTIQS